MGKESERTSITIHEWNLLMRLLEFIRTHDYGEFQLTVHTDNKNGKNYMIVEGTKSTYKIN